MHFKLCAFLCKWNTYYKAEMVYIILKESMTPCVLPQHFFLMMVRIHWVVGVLAVSSVVGDKDARSEVFRLCLNQTPL